MVDSEDDFLQDLAAENKKAKRGDDVSFNEDTEEEAKEEDHSSDDAATGESVDKADKKVEDESTSRPNIRGKNRAILERQRKQNEEGKKGRKGATGRSQEQKHGRKTILSLLLKCKKVLKLVLLLQ